MDAKDREGLALHTVAMQCEVARIANKWPHLMRTALWPGIDKVFIGLSTSNREPTCVSIDLDTAKGLRNNLDQCIARLEAGSTSTGGYPPPGGW